MLSILHIQIDSCLISRSLHVGSLACKAPAVPEFVGVALINDARALVGFTVKIGIKVPAK